MYMYISYSHMEDERIVVALAVLLGVNVPEGGTFYMYIYVHVCVYTSTRQMLTSRSKPPILYYTCVCVLCAYIILKL